MKVNHGSRLRVLLVALVISTALILAPARQASADGLDGLVPVALIAVGLIITYATVMGIVCTPVAAVKASDYPEGFSGAFGDCFSLEMKETAPAAERDGTSDKPAEEEGESWYRDDDWQASRSIGNFYRQGMPVFVNLHGRG